VFSEQEKTLIGVLYDCRKDGKATVELQLTVGSSDGSSGSVCMRWVKQCALGWKNLEIKQGDTLVFKDGQIQEEWQSRMTNEGTQQQFTKFMISAKGIERIMRPSATSNQKLLSVDLMGPLGHSDKSELSREPVALLVMYVCLFDGFADVTLVIEQDTFSGEEPERLEIKWRKHCGETPYTHLEVSVRSDVNKNATKAISGGKVKKGFERPCKGAEAQALAAALGHHGGAHCSNQPLSLEISEKEIRSVLDLEVDKDGVMEPPSFYPPPDVTYDHKVVRVTVLQTPALGGSSGKGDRYVSPKHRKHGASSRKGRQSITLKYMCYKEGVSIVMVTLYVLGFKPIYFAWNKRCVEPKAKMGKALTAPQAIMITLFVCGIVVLAICLCFAFGGTKEEAKPNLEKGRYRRQMDDEGELEMPSKLGASTEVTYH
jgi:hypothetical protein